MEIVEVTWWDACKEQAHIDRKCASKLTYILCKNVGYLVAETEEVIIISWGILENLYHGEMGFDEGFAIPKCMIKEKTILHHHCVVKDGQN